MICNHCDREDEFVEEDGFFYCVCGVQAEGIIATAVADEDFIGDGGGTRGALYNPINTRRPSQPTTPAPPRCDEETMRYSQFRSQLQSATTTQIPQSATPQNREVKREPENLDNEPIEPADFGAVSLGYQDYYEETRDRYVNGFVMMITYQCEALVEKFNVTPLIIGLVAPICLRYVALSGVFDEDWADKAIHESENQSEGEEEREAKRRNRHGDEPLNLYGKRAITVWISELRKCMPLSSTLAISFLACHKAGAPVLPTDIVRWVREGKIPYLSSFLKIKEEMGERSAACPVPVSVMFRPHMIVSAQMLEVRAALIADIIGLPLPPVNFYGIAANYLKRLSIPEDKVLDLVRLIQNWSMPPDLYLSKNELKLPTRVCVMSIIIVAIRMLYNINGLGVWERSLGSDGASEADVDSEEPDSPIHDEEMSETKSAAAGSSEFTKATEFDTEELLKQLEARYHEVAAETLEYEKDLMSYLSHGRKEIFAGLEEESADDRYRTIDKLWNGYPENEESQRLGTPSKRLRDWDDDLSLNQLSLDGTSPRYSDGNNPCNSPSMRTESGSMDHDQCSSEHQVSSPEETHNQEEKSKERLIRRLKTDMGENLFRYIPPRVRVKRLDYLQYVRKREDGALIYPAHADYYILLRVCAKVAEIDARNMHRGVLSFERRLAWIEKRIDQVLHLTPPFMTCEHCCDDSKVVEAEDRDDDSKFVEAEDGDDDSSDNETNSRT